MKTSLEVLTWLTLLGQAVYVEIVWNKLPAALPAHLGKAGVPNAYASKLILLVPIAVSFLVIVAVGIIQQFPEMFSLPKPPRHPDRPRIEELVSTLLASIRLEVAAIFAFILWSIVNLARAQQTTFGVGSVLLSTLLVLVTIFSFVARIDSPVGTAEFAPVARPATPIRRPITPQFTAMRH